MLVYNGPVRANALGEELYGHGTAGFPCGCYYNDPLVSEVPWHWHEELEVVYVTTGELLYLASGDSYHLHAGDAAFVNAGIPHAEIDWAGTHALEGDLVFHPRLLYGSDDSAIWEKYLKHLTAQDAPKACAFHADGEPWEREAISCIARAHTAIADEEPYFEVTAREQLTRLCLLVLGHASAGDMSPRESVTTQAMDRLKHMIKFIEDHYAEELTIGDIADAGNVSAREAQREFRQILGERPMEYLNNHRLFVASQLLKSTDHAVGQIAHDCGFGSQSYFSKLFSARYGHSPGQHRTLG